MSKQSETFILLDSFNQLGAPAYTDLLWCYETPKIQSAEDWEIASKQLEASFRHCTKTKFGGFLDSRITRHPKIHNNRLLLDTLGEFPAEFRSLDMNNGWVPSEDSLATGCTEEWPLLTLSPRSKAEEAWVFTEGQDPVVMVKVTWCHDKDDDDDYVAQTNKKSSSSRMTNKKSFVMIYIKGNHYTLDGLSAVNVLTEWATTHRAQPHFATASAAAATPCTSENDTAPLCVDQSLNVIPRSSSKKKKAPTPAVYATFCPLWIFVLLMKYTNFLTRDDQTYLKLRFPKSVLEQMQKTVNEDLAKEGGGNISLTKNDVLCAAVWKAHYESEYEQQCKVAPGVASLLGALLGPRSWWTTPREKPTINVVGVDCRKQQGLVEDGGGRGARNTFIGNCVVTTQCRIDKIRATSLAQVALKFHRDVRSGMTKESIDDILLWESQRTKHAPGFVFGAKTSEVAQMVSPWRHFPFYDDVTVFGGYFMGEDAKPKVGCNGDPKRGSILLPPGPTAVSAGAGSGDWDVCQTVGPGQKEGFLARLPAGVQVLGMLRPMSKEALAHPQRRSFTFYLLEVVLLSIWAYVSAVVFGYFKVSVVVTLAVAIGF